MVPKYDVPCPVRYFTAICTSKDFGTLRAASEWRQATPLQVFQPARGRTPAAWPCRIHPQMIGLVTPRWMR